jgi:hypothetical protein
MMIAEVSNSFFDEESGMSKMVRKVRRHATDCPKDLNQATPHLHTQGWQFHHQEINMAERHTVLVLVRDDRVDDVHFCDCCPPLTVEVRTYDGSADDSTLVESRPGARLSARPDHGRLRDERGAFRSQFFEPE